jgi:broad specificity phosphatase PhoE
VGLITVVRHGQASSFGKVYDQLSDIGKEQGRLLGDYWANRGIGWDRVLVGPRLRHRETEEVVATAYRARGLPWPSAEPIDDLDEIDMAKVIAHTSGKAASDAEKMHLHEVPEADRPRALKDLFAHMAGLTREYASGRLTVPDAETWEEFKARAQRVLDLMVASGKSKRVLAFSSGGLSGMLVGCALGLTDEKTIDLMMQVRNASYTSFLYSPGKCTLTSFNAVPHLFPDMWTLG